MKEYSINGFIKKIQETREKNPPKTSLEEPGYFGCPGKIYLIVDTLWGLENNIYKPIADLRLPIHVATGYWVDPVTHMLCTVFNTDFMNGKLPRGKEGERLNPFQYTESHIAEGYGAEAVSDNFVYTELQEGIQISNRADVTDHISKCVNLYNSGKASQDSKECLERSIILYSKQSKVIENDK